MTAAPLPVSTWLEQEVLSYTYRSGLTLWLDRDGHYKGCHPERCELLR
jgi:hypothetical protein